MLRLVSRFRFGWVSLCLLVAPACSGEDGGSEDSASLTRGGAAGSSGGASLAGSAGAAGNAGSQASSGTSGQSGNPGGSTSEGGSGGTDAGGTDAGGDGGTAGTGDAGSGGSDAGTAGTGGGAGSAAAGSGGTGAATDPCEGTTPTCPKAPSGFSEGDGLAKIDRCAFPISATSTWTKLAPIVDALSKVAKPVKLATILGDLNRNAVKVSSVPGGPAGVKLAFRWDDDDNNNNWWIPQGLTGSADAEASGLVSGKRVVVVSWYYDIDKQPGATDKKGVRLSFVDVSDAANPSYRHVLLVEPTGTAASPNFKAVNIHAGGLAWYGNLLYVADTSHGFRVFDTTKIFQVGTAQETIGCDATSCQGGLYKYVLPQIGGYQHGSSCSPLFSWVSLDRSGATPALVSGEYCSTSACSGPLAGRVFHWPLDPTTGRLSAPTSWPSLAYLMGQKQVQGGASRNGLHFLSSSAPAGGGGALYRVKPGASKTSTWIDSPEDLMVDEGHSQLWSLSEADEARYVFAAALGSYPAP